MKIYLTSALLICFASTVFAQDIELPKPQRTGGKPVFDAINERQSYKDPAETPVDLQTIYGPTECSSRLHRSLFWKYRFRFVGLQHGRERLSGQIILFASTRLADTNGVDHVDGKSTSR